MRKNSKDLKSLFFIRDHLKELLSSEERTPLERAFSFTHTMVDWCLDKNYNIFGEVTSDGYDDRINQSCTYTNYLTSNKDEIVFALYIYSIMIDSDKELLDMVRSICKKNSGYEAYEDHSELIMIIEMLKTKGDDYKRSKEASNKSSK